MRKVDKKDEWILDNGDVVLSEEITEGRATVEYIEVEGKKICVKGDISIETGECATVSFFLFGLTKPQLRVTFVSVTANREFWSDRDAAIVFEREYSKYLRWKEFDGFAGELFKSRIGACLNYQWSFDA